MTKGIRILDKKDKMPSPFLLDILNEITDGQSINWAILSLDGTAIEGHGKLLKLYEEKIDQSESGLKIQWSELFELYRKFFQIFEIIIIGAKDIHLLRRYEEDKEMYKVCDVVIQLVDCACWKVYSKDQSLIERLVEKYKDVKFLEPDFEK